MAVLGLVVLTLIWSYNWVVMKTALAYIGAFDFTALRCVSGTLLLFIVMRMRGQSFKPTPLVPTAIIGTLQIGGMVGFSQWALVTGGAGKVAVLVYTMPFWVILLAAVFLGERMRRLQYIAVAIAAIGVVLVLQPWHLTGSWRSLGLAVLSGFCWAASAVVTKRVYARYPGIDLLSLTTWQMAFGTVLMVVVAFLVEQKPIEWTGNLIFALTYNAVLATAFCWTLWLYLLKNLPAGIAGLSTLAIPVCGVLFAWWLMAEVPSTADGVGMILIILALALISIPRRQASPA